MPRRGPGEDAEPGEAGSTTTSEQKPQRVSWVLLAEKEEVTSSVLGSWRVSLKAGGGIGSDRAYTLPWKGCQGWTGRLRVEGTAQHPLIGILP